LFYVIPFNMGKKVILMPVCALILASGCSDGSFSISGTIEGAGEEEYLLLREVKPGLLEPVDSVVPGKDGRFSFRSETGIAGLLYAQHG
jgi:hypothetical protein